MAAAGLVYARLDQVAPTGVGNNVVGIVEQLQVEPRICEHLSRIQAKLLDNRRNRSDSSNPDSPIPGYLICL